MSFQVMEQELYALKGPHRKGEDHKEFFEKFHQLTAHLNPAENIVVVGTNGKGTTSQLLFHLLRGAGYKVGLFTSPHLVHLSERFRYEDHYPSEQDLIALRAKAAEKLTGLAVSFFETLTVMALEWFAELKKSKGLDFVIWEAGLGGRFDPAAQVPHETTVLTTISYDHQSLLGDSLAKIAWNKLGALSPNGVLITNEPSKEWEQVLKEELKEKSATWLNANQIVSVKAAGEVGEVHSQRLLTPWGEVELKLLGSMAQSNLQLALCAFAQITRSTPNLAKLRDVQFWGRTQWLHQFSVPVLLSGDHNAEGWDHLCRWLKGIGAKGVILYRLSKEEKRTPFLKAMAACSPFEIVEGALIEPEIKAQFAHLQQSLPAGSILVVTGSLYYVGEWIKTLGVRPPSGS